MNTSLGQLVISLVAETAQYHAALDKASAATQQSMAQIAGAVETASVALAALPVALVASEMVSSVKATVAFAAELDDLSAATGSSVESLSKLANQAKIAGFGFDRLQPLLLKMTTGMAGVEEEGSKTGRALAALGITARDPAEALQQVAVELDKYADGASKAAIARDLCGKGGAQFLATLKNMADMQDVAATVTGEQAAEAEKLEKALRRLSVESTTFKDAILSDVVPAMNRAIEQFVEGRKIAGSFWWAALNFGVAIDPFKSLSENIQKTASEIEQITAGEGASGRWLKYLGLDDKALALANQRMEYLKLLVRQNALSLISDSNNDARDYMARQKPKLDYTGGDDKKVIDEVARALDSMMESLKRTLATEEGLTEVDKVWLALQDGKIDAIGKEHKARVEAIMAIAAEVDQKKALDAQNKAFLQGMGDIAEALKKEDEIRIKIAEASNKAFDEFFEQEEKKRLALEGTIKSLRESVEEQEFEVQIMGLSNAERAKAIMLRQAEKAGIDTTTDSWRELVARMQDATTAKDLAQGQINAWKSIDDAAHDAFTHIFDTGKNVFERLAESLKRGLLDLLYQLTVKRFIINVAASLTGSSSLAAQASSLGGGAFSNLGGAAGGFLTHSIGGGASFASLFGGATTFGSSTFGAGGAGVGFGVGSDVALSGSMFSAIAPIVPWAALAAIAIPMITKLFDSGPANRTGTFASGAGSLGGDPLFRGSSKFGSFGIVNDQWFSESEMAGPLGAAIKTIAGLDNAIAAAVGPDKTSAIAGALAAHSASFGFGTEHTDLNASGAIGAILKDRYSVVLATLDQRLSAVFDKFQGTGDEMGKFVVSLVSLDKIVDKLPREIGDNLIGALDGTSDTLAHVTALAQSFSDVTDLMNRDPLADAIDAIAASSGTAYDSFMRSAQALRTQLDANDSSTDGINSLTNATKGYYAAQVTLLAQIEQIRHGVESMFGDTIRSLTLTTLDNSGKYNYFQDEANRLRDQLVNEHDPQRIQELAGKINDDINSAFGLLDPDQQRAALADYTHNVNELNALVEQKLTDMRDNITTTVGDTLKEVSAQLTAFAADMKSAASTQTDAANTQLNAARTPITVNVNLNTATSELTPG